MSIRSKLTVATLLAVTAVSRGEAQVSVLSSTVEERDVAPGQTYTGRIVVANTANTPQSIRLYQTDYTFKADGTSNFADAGSTPRSNASWITPQANRVTVPPNAEITVPYSIRVPPGDSLSGTYWSAIMVEGAEAPPPTLDAKPNQTQVGIGSVVRYAVQVATNIGRSGTLEVKFENPQAVKTPTGETALDVDVISAGTRAVRPNMSVEVYDAQGNLKGKGKQQRGLLYPGTSLRQHFEFGSLPSGTYQVIVFADTGDKVAAVRLNISY
jgi:hypothetical protein